MTATITVKMDNAAFDDPSELARVLRKLADRTDGHIAHGGDTLNAQDSNGNTVATLEIRGSRT